MGQEPRCSAVSRDPNIDNKNITNMHYIKEKKISAIKTVAFNMVVNILYTSAMPISVKRLYIARL